MRQRSARALAKLGSATLVADPVPHCLHAQNKLCDSRRDRKGGGKPGAHAVPASTPAKAVPQSVHPGLETGEVGMAIAGMVREGIARPRPPRGAGLGTR